MTTLAYCCVSADGRTFATQLVLEESSLPSFTEITRRVKASGTKIAAQLTHAGAFADRHVIGTQQVAPSRVFNNAGFDFPKAMVEADMARVAGDFGRAAGVAKRKTKRRVWSVWSVVCAAFGVVCVCVCVVVVLTLSIYLSLYLSLSLSLSLFPDRSPI